MRDLQLTKFNDESRFLQDSICYSMFLLDLRVAEGSARSIR